MLVYAYRDRTELVASVLEVINGRSLNASQIMYRSFLSYAQMKQYVSILIDAGLIRTYQEENRRRTYRITDKGLMYLHLHNQLDELLLTTAVAPITSHFSSSASKTIISKC
jgi:predicted transcriptional regulator